MKLYENEIKEIENKAALFKNNINADKTDVWEFFI